jgi:tetratricopeptide (TPR) repeat protein
MAQSLLTDCGNLRGYRSQLAAFTILLSGLVASIVTAAQTSAKPEVEQQKLAKVCRSIVLDPMARIAACNQALIGSAGLAKAALLLTRSEIKDQDLDDRAGAIVDADAAARTNPDDANAQNMRCWLRGMASTDLDAGAIACDIAIRLAPEIAAVHDSAGLVALRQGRWQDAWNSYDRAVSLDHGKFSFLYGRGLAALALGRSRDAALDLRAARLAAPEYAELGLDPISIAKAPLASHAGASARHLTLPAFLDTKSRAVEVTIDGKLLEAWVLIDAYPDNSDVSTFALHAPIEVCLRTTGTKTCHVLTKGQTGVYIIRYRKKEYLAHFIA